MPRNLPIQIVETRGEQDVFLKEGGGGNPPKWVTEEGVRRNAATLRESLTVIASLFDHQDDAPALPKLAVAKLDEKATAKSYRANVRELFDGNKKRNVIGVAKPGELLVKFDNRNEVSRVAHNYREDGLRNLTKLKMIGVAAVVGLEPYHAEVEDDLAGNSLKVRLIDYKNLQLNERSEQLFLQECRAQGLEASRVNYADGLRMYRVARTDDMQAVRRMATMDAVISVKKMPYIELSVSPEPDNTQQEVKSPREGEEYPLAGLLDSGVADIPHLTPWLQGDNDNIANLAEHDINLRHGTAVAGVMNYGDDFEQERWTECSPSKIVSCIVNTDPDSARVEEIEMIEYIRTAVQTHPEVKVWNLSQGSSFEVTDDKFSEFAIFLDSMQKEHNILFCKSAGNIDWRKPDERRITQGADSLLSLVVGSIAHRKEHDDDVETGARSSFSKVGPGPESLVKPDLVHYGGNNRTKVRSFSEVGYECCVWSGTSFSTPRVTSLAANLAHRIGGPFDPTLIKALLIHGADYMNTCGLDNTALLHEQGYGLPAGLNAMLNNDEDEFTMVWHPTFVQGDAQIQDIPFPSSLVGDDGLFYGEITVTVVTEPVLKTSEGSEYCQSDVEVLLQTYSGINYVPLTAIGTPKTYRNTDRLIEPQNILAKNLYSRRSWRAADWEERTLIETAFKYQPVKKYHVNLENMTAVLRERYLQSDRKWCLSLKALYRDAVAVDLDYDGIVELTQATVIITIRDPRHKGVAYSECYAALDQHNFAHNDIVIRQQIAVDNQ